MPWLDGLGELFAGDIPDVCLAVGAREEVPVEGLQRPGALAAACRMIHRAATP
jgi:hypothetical protein